MIDKVTTLDKAMETLHDGSSIMVGGFGLSGTALMLVREIANRGYKDLTTISEDVSFALGALVQAPPLIGRKQIKKMVVSFIGSDKKIHEQINSGGLDIELVPQGTLAERIRIGGSGIGGFYTPTGVGTVVEEGKEKKTINGKDYILELPLHADVALIKAYKADKMGNLIFKYSARNFNPLMAMAADTVIVEAEEIVEAGEIAPDQIHLSGVFVDYIVQSEGVKAYAR